MSANPIANGGLVRKPLEMPDFRSAAIEVKKPGATLAGNVPTLGNFLREVMRQNMQNFRVFGPDETESNQLQAIYEVGKKVWLGEYFPEDADGGRACPERSRHGDAQRAHRGRVAGGLHFERPARLDQQL